MDNLIDKRIDALKNAAILTDTQFRLSFAPADAAERVVAMKFEARAAKMDDLQSRMRLGKIVLQVKAGFGAERNIELSGPEVLLLMDAFDRFVTELPAASRAAPTEEETK